MKRPSYLNKYMIDWELLDVVISGKSSLDSKFFLGEMDDQEQVNEFIKGYGLDPNNQITKSELLGNFHEALNFIKRYFLKEGNPEGLDLEIPTAVLTISNIENLFLMATDRKNKNNIENRLWSEVILKIMHTILHIDKDIRESHFSIIQRQILDQFYRYIKRKDNKLYLDNVRLVDFETKSRKSRDSLILKLLHKSENVAEQVFDTIGIRIITHNKFDIVRILKFLIEQYVIIPHNIKPSRSLNTLIDIRFLKKSYKNLIRRAIKNDLTESEFLNEIENLIQNPNDNMIQNEHSLNSYRSIQFTCRKLIRYRNPLTSEFSGLRSLAKKDSKSELAKKILAINQSFISNEILFFYPYEVQIMDNDTYNNNMEGDASYMKYKRIQLKAATYRIFSSLIEYYGIKL